MADSKKKLFSEFPPVSTQEWMAKITEDLKGADFEKKLVWKTNEGFKVKPFYRAEDLEGLKFTDSLPGEFPYIRGTKTDNSWYVRQEIEMTDPKEANEKALTILEKGVNSICFSFSGKDFTAKEMGILLKGIQLECIEINFRTCYTEAAKIAKLLVDYVKANNFNPEKIEGSLNFDPFKRMMVKGFDIDFDIMDALKEAFQATSGLPHLMIFGANPYLFNKAGAYCVQELGYGLAYGNEYLSLCSVNGMPAEEVAPKIKFNFGISSNYFMEIAKFRAARLLWAQIVNAYLPKDSSFKKAAKMNVHATTTEWNQTVYDAYMNLLRSETETMSASIAGVDSITVTPFDNAYKEPDEFSERIARNQQLLLKEEAHFDKVVDVAAGSYYVENLTNSIAAEAWKLFLTIDEKGGFYKALKEGYIQDEVNASSIKRQTAIASRREILVGTNQFPNFNESSLEKVEEGKKEKRCCCCNTEKGNLPTLNFEHGSDAFDALRLATEKSGKRPKVFMLTIGKLSMRIARAQFASNFFACAGYEIVDNLGFDTPEEGVAAARQVKADVIVLCSSDEEYAELAPKAFNAIGKNKEIFVVAGAPACTEDLKAIGINNFISVRSNVLETLQEFNKQLGIN